jgi:HSP20 family protein
MFLIPVSRSPELARSLDRLFDDTFERFFGQSPAATENNGTRTPALDVAETDRGYTVTLDLPGVAKEDVRVSIDGRRVTVQAHTQRSEERKDGERVLYRERAQASYARTFTLPLEIDQSEAGAKLEHGVLTLTLPKRSARGGSQITVS